MRWLALVLLAACTHSYPTVDLSERWPDRAGDYDDVTAAWTRKDKLRGQYQEILDLTATFKSNEWRLAHAERDAGLRGLVGEARDQLLSQAKADAAGPYEIEVMVTTWDRRENDIDRGKKSTWRVVMIDPAGKEVEPLEIVKDRRPTYVVRAEFPALGEFATPYIARFPRTTPLLGPDVKHARLRMSSPQGAAEVDWDAP